MTLGGDSPTLYSMRGASTEKRYVRSELAAQTAAWKPWRSYSPRARRNRSVSRRPAGGRRGAATTRDLRADTGGFVDAAYEHIFVLDHEPRDGIARWRLGRIAAGSYYWHASVDINYRQRSAGIEALRERLRI